MLKLHKSKIYFILLTLCTSFLCNNKQLTPLTKEERVALLNQIQEDFGAQEKKKSYSWFGPFVQIIAHAMVISGTIQVTTECMKEAITGKRQSKAWLATSPGCDRLHVYHIKLTPTERIKQGIVACFLALCYPLFFMPTIRNQPLKKYPQKKLTK